jgi:hypothetical protein
VKDQHRLDFETHQEGKVSFDEYLDRVVFYQERSFTKTQFRSFKGLVMSARSGNLDPCLWPYPMRTEQITTSQFLQHGTTNPD